MESHFIERDRRHLYIIGELDNRSNRQPSWPTRLSRHECVLPDELCWKRKGEVGQIRSRNRPIPQAARILCQDMSWPRSDQSEQGVASSILSLHSISSIPPPSLAVCLRQDSEQASLSNHG
jgi:hypothetical protein